MFATQVMALSKPKQMRIHFSGKLSRGVSAKDVALHLIRTVGTDAGRGHAVEYSGNVVRDMDIEARMTLCNMTIEWGGRTCLIAPDEKTIAWCFGRPGTPSGPAWEEAVAWWRTLATDAGAAFDDEVDIDCSAIAPQITWGTDPAQTMAVTERVPGPLAFGQSSQTRTQSALDYMGLAVH